MTASGTVENLFHYPVKGLSAQPLEKVVLAPGKGFPMDRVYGFARPGSGFDPKNPRPLPKSKFVMLAQDAELAGLRTRYDLQSGVLSIARGTETHAFDLGDARDVAEAEALIARTVATIEDATPALCSADPHRFTDVSVVSAQMMNAVSLINLDSVAAFGRAIGREVDPARFRANVLFSGLPAFAELEMVGREITVGAARLRIILRTKRCPATQVNPETCARDIDVPRLLQAEYGHSDMGVYAEVIGGGAVSPGDRIGF